MYYLQGQTMETIARHLQVSRSSVSRLLAHAREVGLVRISVSASPGTKGTLAGQIADLFGVQVSVVPVHDVHTEVNRLHNVALVAAEHLIDMLFPGVTLGIAWGNTTAEVTRAMPHVTFAGSTVVQLNGAATATESGMPYAEAIMSCAAKAIGGRIVNFPVPAFFDYADTKQALWRERSVQSVLNTIDSADVALFGVGSMSARLPSHVYSGGFLEPDEIASAQNDGVVGDVCTVLIREDGSTNMHLNERASGPPPSRGSRDACASSPAPPKPCHCWAPCAPASPPTSSSTTAPRTNSSTSSTRAPCTPGHAPKDRRARHAPAPAKARPTTRRAPASSTKERGRGPLSAQVSPGA